MFLFVSLADTLAVAQTCGVRCEFRRLYSWVRNGGTVETLPGNLAQLLGWGTGRDVQSWRRGLSESRVSDGVVVRRYAADVANAGGPNLVLLTQLVEGDTGLSFLFDQDGRIVRVFEILLNWDVREVRDRVFDNLGYQIWRIFIERIPADVRP